jgi:ABC-type bacteriocin/lantibiotic exporter with double-glycine peptidase domain
MRRKIPFFKQKNMHFCAPAVAQMILAAYGTRLSQEAIAKEMKTPRTMHEGTKPSQLVATMARHGFSVRAGENKRIDALQNALKKDAAVIVCYTEPVLEWGHYAIVQKFYKNRILLIDPDSRTGFSAMLVDEFKRRWKDPLFTKTVRWAAIVEPKPQKRK